MLTPSLEDYLEEIYRLSGSRPEGGLVRPKELSDRLNVSMPSVTKALQRLKEEGHIEHQAYGDAQLTKRGRLLGAYLVRRNAVLQAFVAALHIECDVGECVEAMEHYIAPEVIAGLERLLAFLAQGAIAAEFDRCMPTTPHSRSEAGAGLLIGGLEGELEEIRQMRRFGGKVRPHT